MLRPWWIVLLWLLPLPGLAATQAPDPRLVGVWRTLSYVVDEVEHPLDGIFIFTDHYFSANVFFQLSGGDMEDANANAGTYRVEDDTLTFEQEVQIHIRPGDDAEPIFYGRNVDEASKYRVEGNRLIVSFPSGNRYICERVEE